MLFPANVHQSSGLIVGPRPFALKTCSGGRVPVAENFLGPFAKKPSVKRNHQERGQLCPRERTARTSWTKLSALLALALMVDFESAAGSGDAPGAVWNAAAGSAPMAPVPLSRVVRGPYLQALTTTSIIIRWRTDQATDSRVQFGGTPEALLGEVIDPALTLEHIVTLTNLMADTKYFYTIGTSATLLAGGGDYFFITAPTTAKATRIWAIGD